MSGRAALLLVLALPRLASGQEPPLEPDAAVRSALTVDPELRAAEAAIGVARATRAEAVPFLGDPAVSGQVSLDRTRGSVGVSVPVSLTGAGLSDRRSASAALDAAEASAARVRRRVAAEARLAWSDATLAVARRALAERAAALAARQQDAVALIASEGEASVLDLRIARLAEAEAAVRLLDALDAESEALRILAERTGVPVSAARLRGSPLDAVPAVEAAAASDVDGERSDLVAARASLVAAERALRGARAQAVPPLSVGWVVELEDGGVFPGPAVGLTVPLLHRNQRGVAEARSDRSQAEGRVAALSARVEVEQQTATLRAAEAERLLSAIGPAVVEEGPAALEAVSIGYAAGELDLTTTVLIQAEILDGWTAALELQDRVVHARVDLLLALDDDRLLAGGAP